jgi:hypothetical protein
MIFECLNQYLYWSACVFEFVTFCTHTHRYRGRNRSTFEQTKRLGDRGTYKRKQIKGTGGYCEIRTQSIHAAL